MLAEDQLPLWMEQCTAAASYYIRPRFGLTKALDYLLAEKLVNFLDTFRPAPNHEAQANAFVAAIQQEFSQGEIRAYLDQRLRQRGGSRRQRAMLKQAQTLLLSPKPNAK